MARTIFPEYRDQYQNTKYPFADTVSLTDSSGEVVIPESLFIDAGFCFPAGFPYLSKLNVQSSQIVLTVQSDGLEALCTLPLDDLPDVLYFKTEQGKSMGCLVSEKARLSWFASLSTGEYLFYPENTAFAVRCNIPSKVLGVSSIGAESGALTGNVWLVGADGVFLRQEGNGVRVDILGEVLFKRARCSNPSLFKTPNYLRTLNYMGPDLYGNLFIGMQSANHPNRIRFNTTPNGIEVKRI